MKTVDKVGELQAVGCWSYKGLLDDAIWLQRQYDMIYNNSCLNVETGPCFFITELKLNVSVS